MKKQKQVSAKDNPKAPHNQPFMGAPQKWVHEPFGRMRVGKTASDRRNNRAV